jgi:hypothetical protein
MSISTKKKNGILDFPQFTICVSKLQRRTVVSRTTSAGYEIDVILVRKSATGRCQVLTQMVN